MMEKIYTIRAVTRSQTTGEFFERLHKIRANSEATAVDWVRRSAEQTHQDIELWRVEDIKQVPHFGRTVTDDI